MTTQTPKLRDRFVVFLLLLGVLLSLSLPVSAALLDLPQLPLASGTGVPSNVMLVFDNSGSMQQTRLLTQVGVQTGGTDTSTCTGPVSVCGSGCVAAGVSSGGEEEQEEGEEEEESSPGAVAGPACGTGAAGGATDWFETTIEFNALAFDPARTYEPWVGQDKNGATFQNQTVATALKNPYDPAAGTRDLSNDTYNAWSDSNSDGLLDSVEGTEHRVQDVSVAIQQQYANWYSYYRSRQYAAKAAFGKVIAEAENLRIGLMTIHNEPVYRVPVAHVSVDYTSGHKATLLNALYSITAQGSTPLRQALYAAGRYLECIPGNGVSDTCPVLAASDGGACQQNFIVMMSDGEYNQSPAGIGNTDGPGSGNTAFDGGAYADGWSDTLADITMHFYERDLHPGLADKVPILAGLDEATHQHVVSYMVSYGLTGTLNAFPSNPVTPFVWPQPTGRGRIDDLIHAAYNGRGGFFAAFSADDLVQALQAALQRAMRYIGSSAAVAVNSSRLEGGTQVYQMKYDTADWSGSLLALPLSSDGSAQPAAWDAGGLLDSAQSTDPQYYNTGRIILSYDRDVTKNGIPFRWTNLSPAMQLALNQDANGNADGQGAARLDYLRGDKSNEGAFGNQYRARSHLLGDIVNSAAYFVETSLYPDDLGPGYSTFRSDNASRQGVLYVGANDGMLHGFSAINGEEKLAYVPAAVSDKLSRLTSPSYTHHYYVDSSPTVGDAHGQFCSGGTVNCWRSVLVSGLRRGGQGFFALDVTDPLQFSEANAANTVLWEFTDRDDPDLGYTYGQPSIVRMANDRWAAVVGNGYNNTEADGVPTTSTSGTAVLYILFLDGGLDGDWTEGTDYIKIDTSDGSAFTPNGLATPAPVDFNGDYTTDYIYAGDLNGNLWKFDVTSTTPSQWKDVSNRKVLAIADVGGTRQPITVRPEAGIHPTDPTSLLIYFGTGKYLESSDNTTAGSTQSIYTIWDENDAAQPTVTRGDLLPQQIIATVANARITSDDEIDWTQHHGWYMDLPIVGERQISRAVLRNDRLIFTTAIPNGQPCETGGSGWLMELDAFAGRRLPDTTFDHNGDGKVDDADQVTVNVGGTDITVAVSGLKSPVGMLSSSVILNAGLTEKKYNSGSDGGMMVTTEHPGRGARGRQAWRSLP